MLYRSNITNFISSEKNRVQNCQTVSNISLVSVVSDPFGVSASAVFYELLISSEIDRRTSKYQVFIDLTTQLPVLVMLLQPHIGIDMSVFPNAEHFTSWIGLTPTNNESANKKKFVRTSHAGTYLKPTFIQCALADLKIRNVLTSKSNMIKLKSTEVINVPSSPLPE